ncbi:MAG: hypothetical protein R2828_06465 [Saprospiraceae bacterium]
MTFIGNLFLVIASLVAFGIMSLVFGTHQRSGDAAVGYAWTLALGNFVFMICMAIVTAIIGSKGGFFWVGTPGTSRFLVVLVGFVLVMMGNGFFSFGEGIHFLPTVIKRVLQSIPAILPILLLVCAAILLNEPLRSVVPAMVYKIPLYLATGLGVFVVGLLMVESSKNAAAKVQDKSDFEQRTHQNHLNQIDATDVMKEIVFLLVFTDANHADDVKERALAKIKSRPDWQEELARRIQTAWAPQVFTFLASNEVDDKVLLAEPVREGVLIQANLIRESIRSCRDDYDLYPDRFTWEIDRVLRSVKKFEGLGVDYRPAVQEMRAALDEPTTFKKPKLHCISMLDKWLKDH